MNRSEWQQLACKLQLSIDQRYFDQLMPLLAIIVLEESEVLLLENRSDLPQALWLTAVF
jgi:hypothetical protein